MKWIKGWVVTLNIWFEDGTYDTPPKGYTPRNSETMNTYRVGSLIVAWETWKEY